MQIRNALTVDVEDYFQVSAFENAVDRKDWVNQPLRVERNTHLLLDLFDEYNTKATFFVLGWVADRIPSIVKEIADRGHEIACHGYSHRLVYNQTPEEFREETLKSKMVLEDLSQQSIYGYRAASYSITNKSLWALDILVDAGFIYDSSIFPVRHDRYGIPDANKYPHELKTLTGNTIVEFPLTTAQWMGSTVPIAGGGYFRLFPYWLTKAGLGQSNDKNEPFIFYLHPWEIDAEQPRIEASWFSKFRHYNNLDKCYPRLKSLLTDFKFTTTRDVLAAKGLLSVND